MSSEDRQGIRRRTWAVTGASGFLGRSLVRALIAQGDRVRAIVRSPPTDPLPVGVELVPGDVQLEESLLPAFEGADGIFHLAGRVARDGRRDALFAVHVEGTANTLRAARKVGVKRIVYASSSGTVAVSREPIIHGDSAPYATKTVEGWPYYESKIHAEAVARRMARSLGLDLVCLRPSLLLGPEDLGASSTEDVRRFIAGDYPMVPKGGLSFLDVRDCAVTFARAMDRAPAGSTYLLGSANMTLRDFFTMVAHVADCEPPVAEVSHRLWTFGAEVLQAAGRLGLIERPDRVSIRMAEHYWYADWSRAVAEIGHAPRPPVETIEDTVAWLQSYGDIPAAEPGKLLRLPFKARSSTLLS